METGFACRLMWAFYALTYCLSVAVGRTEPCSQVQKVYSVWKAHQGELVMILYSFIHVPDEVAILLGENFRLSGITGQVAYDCLRSMPFRSELAVEFLDEYVKYLQFHATIDVLKGSSLFVGSTRKGL